MTNSNYNHNLQFWQSLLFLDDHPNYKLDNPYFSYDYHVHIWQQDNYQELETMSRLKIVIKIGQQEQNSERKKEIGGQDHKKLRKKVKNS